MVLNFQELLRLYLIETKKLKDVSEMLTDVESFMKWATDHLKSPRSVWLFSVAVSLGSSFVGLRAAIRNNNVKVAKGCLYLLKCLAWAENLPLYRQCILRSGIAEEVQVLNYWKNFEIKYRYQDFKSRWWVGVYFVCQHKNKYD